jgi:hypothetical protein
MYHYETIFAKPKNGRHICLSTPVLGQVHAQGFPVEEERRMVRCEHLGK